LVDIFNQDDYNSKKGKYAFQNILFSHWQKRMAIYRDEDYSFDSLEVQLQPSYQTDEDN
jgi:hypothetical protein